VFYNEIFVRNGSVQGVRRGWLGRDCPSWYDTISYIVEKAREGANFPEGLGARFLFIQEDKGPPLGGERRRAFDSE